nr:MAG TPA: Pyocin activator protein PrtN [Bacteriophage sp.]
MLRRLFEETAMIEGIKLLDSASAAKYLGVGRNTLFTLKKDPDFPAPVKLYKGQKKLLWSPEALDRFVELKARKTFEEARS